MYFLNGQLSLSDLDKHKRKRKTLGSGLQGSQWNISWLTIQVKKGKDISNISNKLPQFGQISQ